MTKFIKNQQVTDGRELFTIVTVKAAPLPGFDQCYRVSDAKGVVTRTFEQYLRAA